MPLNKVKQNHMCEERDHRAIRDKVWGQLRFVMFFRLHLFDWNISNYKIFDTV